MLDLNEKIQNAVEWIEALAADEYGQTTRVLGSLERGFCCLGVARHECFVKDSGDDLLSLAGARDMGLYSGFGRPCTIKKYDHLPALVSLNDEAGYTFPQIAQHLLSNLTAYFRPDVAEGIAEYFWGSK